MLGLLRTVAVVAALLALACSWALRVDNDMPPKAPPSRRVLEAVPAPAMPEATLLSVWEQPAVAAAPRPKNAPPAPAPPTPPPAIPVDRTSLKYLGSVKDAQSDRFLIKILPTGQVLNLAEGQNSKGWTLVARDRQTLRLQGPGGLYEVVY
jgi:hypothetical protein